MPTFSTYNNRLPDPTFGVSYAGSVDNTGSKGPGFASVTFSSDRPTQVSRTVSGRGVSRESGAHQWNINITYNPMRRDQFETVSTFLDNRNGRLYPFFVVLPQYSVPRDSSFAVYCYSSPLTTVGTYAAGSRSILVQGNTTGLTSYHALPGDFFNVYDPADVNHLKTYRVTAVETNILYEQGTVQPAQNQFRIHITPPLVRQLTTGSTTIWIEPKFRVIQKSDILESQLSTDNLYTFQLQLEEILP